MVDAASGTDTSGTRAQDDLRHQIVEQSPTLRIYARRFCHSPNDIDDLVQETLCRAISYSHKFTPGTSLKAWLFTIMRNTFCTLYRKQRREVVCADNSLNPALKIGPAQEWAVRQREVSDALGRLSEDKLRALIQISLGASYDEAAVECGCEVGTVKSRVSRARRILIEDIGNPALD